MALLPSIFGSKRAISGRWFSSNSVKPDNRSLLSIRKWVTKRGAYVGFYKTKHGSWFGNIRRRGDRYRVYVKNPPVDVLKGHCKWICFQPGQKGWYEINLRISPKDNGDLISEVSSIIAYVERLFSEAYRLTVEH